LGYVHFRAVGESVVRIVRFIIAAAASSAAVAQQAPPAPPVSQPPITVTGQNDADKPVCKYVDTGSLIPRKVCMPKSEWARAQRNTDDEMRSMRDWQRVRCNMGTNC
jgi:hypothetical protein